MPNARHPFRTLFRSFLSRIADLEILSPGGEAQKLAIEYAAMLAAFNFVVAIVIVPRYGLSVLPRRTLQMLAWGDEEFLISTTITIVGILMVLAWDMLTPDLRDAFVFGVLPVRLRTIVSARLAAVGSIVAIAVLLANVFTGFAFALVASPQNGTLDIPRCFAAYWITMLGAGVFVAGSILALQGLLKQALTHRMFLRLSSYLQMGTLFLLLATYFLKPPWASIAGLTARSHQLLLHFFPSYWFLGLFQEINGPMHPVFGPLAKRAIFALLLASVAALAFSVLGYNRNARRLLEEPDIASSDRARAPSKLGAALVKIFVQNPLDRAIVLFTARSFVRSRRHRLLFALYAGIGLAIALVYAESLIRGDWVQRWNEPNAPLMTSSLVMLFFTILGMRLVFIVPSTLSANWIFRVTLVHNPAAYFRAVRRSIYLLATLPLWTAFTLFFVLIWPMKAAILHAIMLASVGVLITEKALFSFRKIPFTCSYLPGKANLKVTLALYGSAIFFLAFAAGQLEQWSMRRNLRYCILISVILSAAIWAWRQRAAFAHAPYTPVQFEDSAPNAFQEFNLASDADYAVAEGYIDSPAMLKQTAADSRL